MKIAILTTDNREPLREYQNPVPWFGTAPEALLQGFSTFPRVEVHVVSCTQQPMPSPEKLAENIWFHSVPVPKIGWLRTGYQGCIRAVRRELRGIKPDIVHGQGTERDCAISAVWSGFPNVLTIHGNMRLVARVNQALPFSYHWLAARLEAFTIPRSQGVVCLTNHARNAVANLIRRTWVVPNAVDQRFFDVRFETAAQLPPMILCVGSVCRLKNQNNLIGALDSLAAECPLRLVFLGSSSRKDAYGRKFHQLIESRPWCEPAGFVSRDQLRSCLGRAAGLVLPSLEENCPMVVLEAMAAGTPVVAAQVGGMPDLIQAERTGLFCDPLSLASMRAAVARLLKQPELGRALAAEAKRDARERFHPATIARRHLEIYEEVLSTRS